jgi:NAD(P)-dependent dehydrogenase (short-subunit alcohol dehydrogenase family)
MARDGKHALVTGSSRGIGRGIVLKLAEQGVKVAINYRKNEAAAKDTLAKVRQRGAEGFIVQADVCRPDDITSMFGRVKSEFGTLDIFVSNARPEVPEFYQGPMDITLEQWDCAMNSQAKAFLLGVRAGAPLMGRAAGSSPSPTRPVAAPAAGSPGSAWARPRALWSRCAVTSPWRSPNAASP